MTPQPEREALGLRIEVNERGTPMLIGPADDPEMGEYAREATVAEWAFWKAAEQAEQREAELREALQMLWDHYLLVISDEQKQQVLAALSEQTKPEPRPGEEMQSGGVCGVHGRAYIGRSCPDCLEQTKPEGE